MGETRYAGTKIHIPTCACQRCTLAKMAWSRVWKPKPIHTSTIHSRTADKKCIASCICCKSNQEEIILDQSYDKPLPKSRPMSNSDFWDYTDWLGRTAVQRFRGDPLDHDIEKVFDMLVDLFIQKRRRDEGN